ncbi:MAG: cytochrome c553 [bacterium]|jgi:cytochrome c553
MKYITIQMLYILIAITASCSVFANSGKILFKSQKCIICHGEKGQKPMTPNVYPQLAGQDARYLYQQMRDIKQGKRKNGNSVAMWAIIQNTSDQDLKKIATYLEKQKGVALRTKELFPNKKKLNGKQLFVTKGCNACHGDSGKDPINPMIYPKIAGQHPQYLYQQMKDIKNKIRNNSMSVTMRGIIRHLSNDEMKAIANYLNQTK